MHSAKATVRRVSSGLRQGRAAGIRRRSVLAAAVGLAGPLVPRFARAAEVTWRIGHGAPATFPLHIRLTEAAATIAARSNGQMEVKIYPDNQLGIPVGLLAQLRAGTIDAVPLTSQMLAGDLPVAALPMVGFAFAGYEKLWPAMDGDLGRFLRDRIRERLGLVAMDSCWDFGFRQITTSGKVVSNARDMAGLRLRTPPEPDFIALFQALKALPLAMPLSSVARALTSQGLDGQESLMALVQAAGLFKELSVCALTNHVWDGPWICVSGKSWSKLPANLRDIAATALNESGLHHRQDTAADEASVRKELEAGGMKFNAVDAQSFRAVLRGSGYYASWHKKVGDDGWAALTKYAGSLD